MRKRTINHILDKIFWYTLYLLPIIVFIICLLSSKSVTGSSEFEYVQALDLEVAMAQTWEVLVPIVEDSAVSTTIESMASYFNLESWLGVDSFFNNFFTYYIYIIIFHLVVDILLFIPKLSHKWIGGFINEE